MATTLGKANALRYRGYVYDPETALYYLQSRYYNPGTGRFINADTLVSTGQGLLGNNMFAYCRNNPVIRKDASGAEDVCVEDFNQDNNPLNDLGRSPSGGTSGSSLIRAFSAALAGAAVLASANKIEASNTKILADVKKRKLYQLAYVNKWGVLVKIGKKMTYGEALVALGITGAVNGANKM